MFRVWKGREVIGLYKNESFNFLIRSKIYMNPYLSTKAISEYFGVSFPFEIGQIKLFSEIEDYLVYIRKNSFDPISLALIAPHTHWNVSQPIVYRERPKENRYVVGNLEIHDSEKLFPSSFVVCDGNLLPFEWVECSDAFEFSEWERNFSIIEDIAAKFPIECSPFGLAISYRFKRSLWDDYTPSMEIETDDNAQVAEIITMDEFVRRGYHPTTAGAVAWQFMVEERFSLTSYGDELFRAIRGNLHRHIAKERDEKGEATLMNFIEKM